ncbi:MAG: hypothetical protein ACP5OR_08250 [Candidatus Dormibacteria bacterium]
MEKSTVKGTNMVRIGTAAILFSWMASTLPGPAPHYGQFTATIRVSGTNPPMVVEGPPGFVYRQISDWNPPVSSREAIADAWTIVHETVYALAPVHVEAVTLGEYSMENSGVHDSVAAAWIVVFSSRSRMLSGTMFEGHFVLDSGPNGLPESGGYHSVVSISAYTGEAIAPFLGGGTQ